LTKKAHAKIRLGIVGCGGVTEQRHLPALRRVRGIEVRALADSDSARLERVAAQFGVARSYGDYRELIERAEVDAVAVCVPPQLHAMVALAALEAGKHVLIEKPLALSLAECDLLLESSQARSALKVMLGFNLRWHRLVREAREIIMSGELGRIKLVRTVFTSGVRLGADFAEWRRRRETGGGALFELGVHHFDLLRFLLGGEPLEICATSVEGDETATVIMQMEGDTQVVAAFSEGTGENQDLEVYGEKGWLRVSCYRADGLERFDAAQSTGALRTRLRQLTETFLDLPGMVRQSLLGGDYVASYAEEWRHFAEAIGQDSKVECGLLEGRRALEIALAAMEAGAAKRAVLIGKGEATREAAELRQLRAISK
jgi:myo-inositol 2-dehydrogenase/D-chiro-inositol 1-dehydrogenase